MHWKDVPCSYKALACKSETNKVPRTEHATLLAQHVASVTVLFNIMMASRKDAVACRCLQTGLVQIPDRRELPAVESRNKLALQHTIYFQQDGEEKAVHSSILVLWSSSPVVGVIAVSVCVRGRQVDGSFSCPHQTSTIFLQHPLLKVSVLKGLRLLWWNKADGLKKNKSLLWETEQSQT